MRVFHFPFLLGTSTVSPQKGCRGTALAAVASPRALPRPRCQGVTRGPRLPTSVHLHSRIPKTRGFVTLSRFPPSPPSLQFGRRRQSLSCRWACCGVAVSGTQLPSAILFFLWCCISWSVVLKAGSFLNGQLNSAYSTDGAEINLFWQVCPQLEVLPVL